MTNESKENLLKILLNEPEENPGTNIGTLVNDGYKNTTISSSISTQLSFNNYTIILSSIDGYITLFDDEYNVLFADYLYINGTNADLRSLDIDDEGNLYGIAVNNDEWRLVYLNNLTQKTAEGNYELYVRKSYSLTSMVNDIGNTMGSSMIWKNYILKKSPTDSRFVIIVDTVTTSGTNNNLIVISYTVNFNTPNEYDYRYTKVGTYDANNTQDIYVDWSSENLFINMFSINAAPNSYDYYTATGVKYYWSSVEFTEGSIINSVLVLTDNSCIRTGAHSEAFITYDNKVWFVNAHKSGQDITATLYLYGSGNLQSKLVVTGTEYCNSNMVYSNNQLFISLQPRIDASNNRNMLLHIIGTTVNTLIDYNGTYYTWTLLITSNFNLYGILLNTYRYKYIYNSSGYNGTEYFSDKSVTPESVTLNGINTEGSKNVVPIFSRNLYNKSLIGNSIISTVQVPFTYLNNSIISKEDLISLSNNIIDEEHEEIGKNKYEELYINYIDSFKVYDNNVGNAYNQNSSLDLVGNINNGFEGNYKITKYRVNYKDGTHKDYALNHITRTGREATIEIYVKNDNVDNIEIYDDNFTYAFVTISLDGYDNKIYKITEHIKVE